MVIEIGAAEGWVQDLALAMGLSILDRQGMSWPGGQSGWNNQALAALTHMAQADVRVQQLQSIPGVGPRLAEVVVAVIDDANRFKTAKQVEVNVGLTPKQFESGTMKRQGGVSGRGNKLLRALLVQVSWLERRYNGVIRSIYEEVCRGDNTRKKIAVIATARRLLVICWAMLRDGTLWREPSRPAVAQAGI